MSNIFYFDEVGAFGNGIPTPQSTRYKYIFKILLLKSQIYIKK